MNINGIKILFAGSGAFGVPSLQRLMERGAEIVHVYTQPSKPAGRGNKLTPTPIGEFATKTALPLTETSDINALSLPSADLLVVIAFGQKLGPHVVDHARFGSINLHASRLPKYRGAAPINWAIIRGEKTTGNSVIRLAQAMDAGAVLAMSELPIGALETAGELHDRLSLDGADLVEQVAGQLRDGSARPLEQDHSLATKAPKLSREKATIDFTRDAVEIANQIRGMHPWPGCRVRLMNREGAVIDHWTLIRARVHEQSPNSKRGEGPFDKPGMFDLHLLACGRHFLVLEEIQPDGRKRMSLQAYMNGKPIESGYRLESM